MPGVGILNRWHVLRDNLRHDGQGIPVGAGEYTCEAVADGILFADQSAVDTYATARGFAAGQFKYTALP